MRKTVLILILAAAPISAVVAQNMPLPQFLAKAAALEKKGALALFSSDMGLLKKEIRSSAGALRNERIAAQRAGRKPAYCPPAKPEALGVSDILGHFRSIPADRRARMTTRDAFRSLLVTKYPCPA
jgi:hypothetical protein